MRCYNILVTELHGGSRNEETRSITNRVLLLHRRRRHRNTGKDIDTGFHVDINTVDINNNRQET